MKLHSRRTETSLRIYLGLTLLFLFAPILVTIAFSFNSDRFSSLPWRGFSLHWYAQMLSRLDLLTALRNSAVVGVGVAAAAVLLGCLGAYGLRHSKIRGKNLLLLGMISPLAVPWMLLGLGLLILFTRLGIRQSLLTVWISHLVFSAPLSLVLINTRLNTVPKSLDEAAWDLGASHLQTILRVIIPQALPGIIAAGLLVFTLSFDEFIISWFVCGFSQTLPVYIYGMIRSGINPTINAIGTVVFTVSIALTIIAQLTLRRAE
ncbi:MAG: ABC transporter permease [bacterium]|jgi:spermidine/putrescine transport system permease protein